jgi:glycerophosphoryl diester phosphodiesterase
VPLSSLLPRGAVRPGHPYLAGGPLLLAHRGGSAFAPENTLPAFRQALDWWRADVLEIDVQPSREGEAVVIHDPTLERTCNGSGPVSAFTLAELRELDAGYRFTPDGQEYPWRGRGVGFSTLREVLEVFPQARVNVEIKDARAQEAVWATVHALDAVPRVLIAAGDRRNRARFARYGGAVSAGRQDMYAFYALYLAGLERLWRPSVDAFQMPEVRRGRQVLGPGAVRALRRHNLAVHVWTINEREDMRRLLDWGVDGIVTDRPDRMARLLHERCGRALPPGPPAADTPPWMARLLAAG